MDWAQYDLATIFAEIRQYLAQEQLTIPLIPAGGIFTGGATVGWSALATGAQVEGASFLATMAQRLGVE